MNLLRTTNALNLQDFLEYFEFTLLCILHPRYNSILAENRMGDTFSLKITGKVSYIQHLDQSRYDSTDLFRIINRNGSDYPAEKGVSHIEMKYDYFRDDIKSSEDFIEYSATKSTMSGNYYMVTCPGKPPMKTQDWLLTELNQFRMENK